MVPKLLLASAGAGKSVRIVESALKCSHRNGKVLLLTYTINNQRELIKQICRINNYQPENVVIKGWFSFLLDDMIRPYQRCVLPDRVSGINFNAANPHLGTNGAKLFNLKGRAEKIGNQFNPVHFVTKYGNLAHTLLSSEARGENKRKVCWQTFKAPCLHL